MLPRHLIMLALQKLPKNYHKWVEFLTFQEVKENNLPQIKELQNRKKGYIYFKNKLYTNISLKNFTKKNNFFISNNKEENNSKKEIKGKIAFHGVVRGVVKILFERSDVDKIKPGNVLVSPMTTPNYIQAMEKASAIITDEGGITCHAAIIAREMQKPCIIGTKNATQVLHDGDLVEVDANKGIIKILK